MDDPTRTRKTLDALAELYLTGIDTPQPPSAKAVAASTSPHTVTTSDWSDVSDSDSGRSCSQWRSKMPGSMSGAQPTSRSSEGLQGDDLDGPEPIRLFPEAVRYASPSSAGSTTDFGIGLSDKSGADDTGTHEHPAATRVEAIFLGNLPGFSGPWLTQYAWRVSGQCGPVGIVTIDGSDVDVELVGESERVLDELEDAAGLADPGELSVAQVVERLSRGHSGVSVRAWLVHFPTPIAPEARARAIQIKRWTILCGSDDAAVVGAYRLLKQLTGDPAPTSEGEANELTSHRVGVMVMGSDGSVGQGVAAKLSQAAGSFLSTPVELEGWQKQMRPVHMRGIGYFTEDDGDPWSRLKTVLEQLADGSRTEAVDSEDAMAAKAGDAQLAGSLTKQKVIHDVDEQDDTSVDRWQTAAGEYATNVDELEDTVVSEHLPAPDGEIQIGTDQDAELDLCAYVSGDCERLEARCPYWLDAQLAVDERGRLHVLMRFGGQDTAADDGSQRIDLDAAVMLRAAVMGLMEVGQWAHANISLLRLACPGGMLDESAQPVLHLFTDHAKPAAAIVGRLGELVKVHLLQEVYVGASSAWCCAALN